MSRAFGYVRLSMLTESTTSPERQREAIAALAKARGFELVETFEDLDVSGFSGVDRPGLDSMLDRLSEAEHVIVWKLDRLGRRTSKLLADVERMDAAGVSLVSVSEGLDFGGPTGKLLLTMLGAVAEMESSNTSARTRSSQEYLASQGFWRGGRIPYGWRPVSAGDGHRKLALDEAQAEVLRYMVDRVVDDDWSITALTADLHERGVKPPGGSREWRKSVVHRIMNSGNLIGAEAWVEPLLTSDRYRRLRSVLESRSVQQPARRRNAWLLSGIARCGSCENPMHLGNRSGTDSIIARCHYRPVGAKPCPRKVSVSYPKLLEEVERQFLAVVGRANVVEVIELAADPASEERARAQIALDALADQLASGALSATAFAAASQRLEPMLQGGEVAEPGQRVHDTGEQYAERWAREGDTHRRQLLSTALQMILVHPGRDISERVELVWD